MKFLVTLSLLIVAQSGLFANGGKDTLHWHPQKKLAWEHFSGALKQEVLDKYIAEAYFNLMASFEKTSIFAGVKTNVKAVFHKQESWCHPQHQNTTKLLYFQVMFDMYELYARKMKEELHSTTFGADPEPTFNQIYTQINEALKKDLEEYRTHTNNGLILENILDWHNKNQKQLIVNTLSD